MRKEGRKVDEQQRNERISWSEKLRRIAIITNLSFVRTSAKRDATAGALTGP